MAKPTACLRHSSPSRMPPRRRAAICWSKARNLPLFRLCRAAEDGTGYELIILEDISASLQGADKESVATQMNRAIERAVLMAPEQYMWLHRRFKTRPEGVPDRYARKNLRAPRAGLTDDEFSQQSGMQH